MFLFCNVWSTPSVFVRSRRVCVKHDVSGFTNANSICKAKKRGRGWLVQLHHQRSLFPFELINYVMAANKRSISPSMSGYSQVPKTKSKTRANNPDSAKLPNEEAPTGPTVDTASSLLSAMKRHNLKLLERALEESSIGMGHQRTLCDDRTH
jgi:hypothetical protein